MGLPSPLLEATVLDEDDNQLPPGEVGQLAFRPRFPGLLLTEYIDSEMPRYMRPSYLRFVPALPVTPTSKIEKYKLKNQLLEELNQG